MLPQVEMGGRLRQEAILACRLCGKIDKGHLHLSEQHQDSLIPWAKLKIPDSDFDVAALHSAINEQRLRRKMSWNAVALEVNRADERHSIRPISASTISGLKSKRWGVEGDGVLQMLLWLDRSPESFVPGHPGAERPDARLPRVGAE